MAPPDLNLSVSYGKALDAYTDGTPGWGAPTLASGALFRDIGSTGLRQYGGYVREEFLRALQGLEAQRVYREMGDNSAVVGAILFAITQAIRKINWREAPANDTPAGMEAAEFAQSLRMDMTHPWEDHVVEALSMLQYGFAPCEIVYKRRLGPRGDAFSSDDATSKYKDGKIGIRRLPLRGQETISKWFFDENGQVTGLTQQPWMGPQINLPIAKLLLYRPTMHKNNPEGRSILRTGYRAYYFLKRIEELEAILFERMGGLPIVRVPNALLEQAKAGVADAVAALEAYKSLAKNVRVDEQMGIVMPSDTYKDGNGSPTAHRMYEFELKTPDSSALRMDSDKVIRRYNVDIMKSVLADFIDLGHQARGTQNLAMSKIDMFYHAIEGWISSLSSVMNRYLLPRVWYLNGMDMDLMPHFLPDLSTRVDLAVFGKFILDISTAGMPLFPDRDLENYVRDAAGMPTVAEEDQYDPALTVGDDTENLIQAGNTRPLGNGTSDVAKHILGLAALKRKRELLFQGRNATVDTTKLSGTALDNAAQNTATAPTPAQRSAGNYRMGHVRAHGLQFSIETPRGAIRSGQGKDGPWQCTMPTHYGYLRRTTAADGEQLDVYLGPEPDLPNVWVIDQLDAETGTYDEAKVFVGFRSIGEVLQTYRAAFSDGRADERLGAIHRVTVAGLKQWVKGGDLTTPAGALVGKRAEGAV